MPAKQPSWTPSGKRTFQLGHRQAATDVADFAFDSIVQRGRDEAATEPAG